MIFSDATIRHYALKHGMINPFIDSSVSKLERNNNVTSYGLTSYGYDIRLGKNFVFYRGEENKMINFTRNGIKENLFIKGEPGTVVDPNNFDTNLMVQVDGVEEIYIPPKTFFMGVSEEYIKVPRNVKVKCDNKSTCARAGVGFFVTPLEPEWEGFITLEFFNNLDSVLKLTPGMGISQLEFITGDAPCEISYRDRKGKYNHQGNQPVPPLRKS